MKVELTLQKIKNNFPEIKWKKHRIITHGFDHVIIILDEKIIFRLPKNKEYKDVFENEIQLLHYLKKKVNIGIPDYIYISKDKSLAGYKMLNGRELNASCFYRLSALEKDVIAKQLAEFISTLHATPMSVINKYNVQAESIKKEYNKFIRDTKKLVFPRLSKKEVQIIEDYFNELKDALDQVHPDVLVHNDLTSTHILWDNKENKVNIIDFSDRVFGDPASDFAGLWEYGNTFVKKVYKSYRGEKDDTILYRSRLYFKRIPLSDMKNSLQGHPRNFGQGYTMFKKIFKV